MKNLQLLLRVGNGPGSHSKSETALATIAVAIESARPLAASTSLARHGKLSAVASACNPAPERLEDVKKNVVELGLVTVGVANPDLFRSISPDEVDEVKATMKVSVAACSSSTLCTDRWTRRARTCNSELGDAACPAHDSAVAHAATSANAAVNDPILVPLSRRLAFNGAFN